MSDPGPLSAAESRPLRLTSQLLAERRAALAAGLPPPELASGSSGAACVEAGYLKAVWPDFWVRF